jgi:hypothetical protein
VLSNPGVLDHGTNLISEEGSSSGSPASRWLETSVPFLIFVICLAYLCLFLRYSTLEPDEGIVLQGAERILHGEVPYRDFFSFYTPGSFYFIALLFRIFGDSFAVARLSIAFSGAACSVVTYLLARRVCSRTTALLVAALATTAGAAFRFLVLHNPLSTMLCCLAIYLALKFIETKKSTSAFASASFASLCFLFEQSKGTGLCAGLIIGFLLVQFAAKVSLIRKRTLLALFAGFLWPMLITLAHFATHHATRVMLQSWVWPLQHYTQANHVPYGFQNWSDESRDTIFYAGPIWLRLIKTLLVSPDLLITVLPLIGIVVTICWIVRAYGRADTLKDSAYYIFLGSVFSGLLASVVLVRPDILHFVYLAPLWYVILSWVLGATTKNRLLTASRPYLFGYVAVAFGLLGIALLLNANGSSNRIPTGRGDLRTGEKETVLPYLIAHNSGQQLLVYPYLPLYNYLTETRSPSRYDFFQPGMNTPEQAQEIIGSLKSRGVPVLFEPWFSEKFANSWPGTRLGAIANDPVADHIARNYRVCAMLMSASGWRFHYMVEKETSCP